MDKATKWNLQTTLQCLSHLIEEVGELTLSINRIYEYKGEAKQEHQENLKHELIDTLWFLVKIANRFDIDLEAEVKRFTSRADNWPIDKYHSHLVDGLRALDKELFAARAELDLE